MVTVVVAVPPDVEANVPVPELEAKLTTVDAVTGTGFPYTSWTCTRMGPMLLVLPWAPDTEAVAIVSCEADPAPMTSCPLVSALTAAVPVQVLEANPSAITEKFEVEAGVVPFAVCTVNVQVA
jgi:hypothetical protein